jgi:FecR protein
MMKRFVASLVASAMLLAGLPVGAQDSSPSDPPADGRGDQGYGAYAPPNSGNGQYSQASEDQDSQQPAPQDQNQPGVARISFISGDVSSQRGDNGQWVAVTVNAPLAVDDRVSTGDRSRAELQLDYADVLRMSDRTTAKIAALTRAAIQVQIGQGLATYNILKGNEATVEIDTPNATIHPLGEGEYRVIVNSDSQTDVVVRGGAADISTPQGSTHVEQGQMITVAGTDSPQYRTVSAPLQDEWDSWNNSRNQRITTAQSWHDTDRYYTGSEDLDTYGTWSEVPDYGRVWTPSSAGPDWAPYRSGRWVYQPYYGWTWVSYEPWGWAPYHYGRWFVYGGSWVWWPGPVGVYPGYYPVWAPAYVSFFGFGVGFGFGIGFGFGGGYGRYGWLPCGPGDWYHPWFGRYGNRYNTVNVTNIHNTTVNNYHNGIGPLAGSRGRQFSNINQAMTNDRVRGGISSMAGNEFGRGAVSPHQTPISSASFRQAALVAGKMPATPSRESYSPSGREANPSSYRSAPPSSQHFLSAGSRTNAEGNYGAGSRTFGSTGNVNNINASHTNPSTSLQSSRSGWKTFTPPSSANVNRSQSFDANTHALSNSSSTHGTFAPESRQSSQGTSSGTVQGRQAENRSSWQHFSPPQSASRESSSHSYSRPSLNMRQPIVTSRGGSNGYAFPRSPGSYSGGYSNAPRNSGAYNYPRAEIHSAPQPTYSAPHSGGGSGGSGNHGGGGSTHGGGGGHGGHSH